MQLQLRWKLVRRRRELDAGTGRTIDMSSGGILFQAGCELPPGMNVELSIAWPALLHNVRPMQLFVTGRVVRSQGDWAAIRTLTHEFRTVGIPMPQREMTMPRSDRAGGVLIHMQRLLSPVGL
jgi:hypothetical protein